jgi:ribosomal protein S14
MKKCIDCGVAISNQALRCKLHSYSSLERSKKISLSKLGSKNKQWKGDSVSYGALHDWVKWHFKKQSQCNICGKKTDCLDLANISQKYKRDLNDWEWICRRCHMIKDGRITKLIEENKLKTKEKKYCTNCGKSLRLRSKVGLCRKCWLLKVERG